MGIQPLIPLGISRSSPGVGVRILGKEVIRPFEPSCGGRTFPFVGVGSKAGAFLDVSRPSSSGSDESAY